MLVTIEEEKIKLKKEENSIGISFNEMYVELTNVIRMGKCICCGGTSIIAFGGGIIFVGCSDKDESGMRCVKGKKTCLGIDSCIHKDKLDTNRDEEYSKIIGSIIENMNKTCDVIWAVSEPIVRKALVKHFLDQNVMIKEMKGKNGPNFFKITFNKKYYEREKLIHPDDLEIEW